MFKTNTLHKGLMLGTLSLFSASTFALDILLTNDDGYRSEGISIMRQQLEEAGHTVTVVAPLTQQSGRGGAILSNDTGSTSIYWYGDVDATAVDGTPVASAWVGLDYVYGVLRNGAQPDLVVSGINEGENLGSMASHSGTVGAASTAVVRGLPAIAISAGMDRETYETPSETYLHAANYVVDVIEALEATRQAGEPLMPKRTGLNINVPTTGFRNEAKLLPMGYESAAYQVGMVLSDNHPEGALNFTLGVVSMASGESDTATETDETEFVKGYTTVSILNGSLAVQEDTGDAAALGARLESVTTP